MNRGMYSAASGMFTEQRAINVLSGNVANVNTAGYRNKYTVQSSFGDYLISRLSTDPKIAKADIGSGSYITVNDGQFIDFTQGSFEVTSRSVDMAVKGQGFFVVQTDNYGQILTRSGQFEVAENGDLVLPGVGTVLSTNEQPITLNGSEFTLTGEGDIVQNGQTLGRLYIANVQDQNTLNEVGEGFYETTNGFQAENPGAYSLLQGNIEKSNVNMTKQMSEIIKRQSNYTSCSQVLKIFDRLNEIAANQIGKVG